MSALSSINSQALQLPSHANTKAYSFQRLPQDLIGSILSSGLNWQERMSTQQTCWAARKPLFQKEAPAMPWFKTASALIGFLKSEAVPMYSKKVSDLNLQQMLYISNEEAEIVTNYLPELEGIRFHSKISASAFQIFTEKYPNLISLKFPRKISCYNEIKDSVLARFKNLQHLDLSQCNLESYELQTIVTQMPYLKTLNLANSIGLHSISAIQNCPNLRYLNLKNSRCSYSTFETVIKNLPLLETLVVDEVPILTIAQCKKLENLTIKISPQMTPEELLEIANNCPIKNMTLIYEWVYASDESLLRIRQIFPPTCQITCIYKYYKGRPFNPLISEERVHQLKDQGIILIIR